MSGAALSPDDGAVWPTRKGRFMQSVFPKEVGVDTVPLHDEDDEDDDA